MIGENTTYASFESINLGTNSQLSFEFSASAADALLIYLDDGGFIDFLEIRLVGGRMKARLKLSPMALQMPIVGTGLSSG